MNKVELVGQPLRYASYVYDNETSLYYLQARYNDPETARFVARDPYRENVDPLSQNLYVYAIADPTNLVDPSGRIAETALDTASIGVSSYNLYKNPSWINAGYLAWDVGAAFIPFVPGSWTVKTQKSLIKMDLQLFAKKADLKMVDDAAKQVGIDRNLFGEYIHELKAELRMKASDNFTYKQLVKHAEELKKYLRSK